MSRAARVSALVALAVLLLVPAAQAYLKLGARVGNRVIAIEWDRPVQYFVTNRDVEGVTAAQLQTVVHRAFGTWEGVNTASFAFQFAGFTNAEPFAEDDISVIGFRSRPDLERTLGATIFRIDELTGRIIESDIFLNSNFPWSVASGGQPSRWDVESISVHEIGHLLGLGHSALGETEQLSTGGRRVLAKRAVMFPIAYPAGNIADRSLQQDDVAGISDIYPSNGFTGDSGAISGRIRLGGSGVFGAHVTAFNPATGLLIGGFSLDSQGNFVIAGLTPGLYVVRVEPLDDADIDSFFDDDGGVNINFRPAYYSRLVPVPAGGSSGSIEISVQAK